MRMGRSKRRLPESLTQHLSDQRIVAFKPRTDQHRANLRTEAAKRFCPLGRNHHRRRAGRRIPAAPLVAFDEAASVIFIAENDDGPGSGCGSPGRPTRDETDQRPNYLAHRLSGELMSEKPQPRPGIP